MRALDRVAAAVRAIPHNPQRSPGEASGLVP